LSFLSSKTNTTGRHHIKKIAASFATVGLAFLSFAALSFATVAPANAGESQNVEICHATSSDKNPYNSIAVSKTALVHGTSQHSADGADIIPSFGYTENGVAKTFPGKNWDAVGQATFQNSCVVPNKAVTPVAPTFVQATCMNKTGTVTLSDQPEGSVLNVGPKLNTNGLPGSGATGSWVVDYDPAKGFEFPKDNTGTFTIEVKAPGASDPNWDAESGSCALSNTGASIKSEHILYAGILIFAGLVLTTVARRKS